ncbi:uncharacterized protein LOC122953852 [Acropora millepora]|uniref:uncharacterized protein LOC122953852 n=1 Tax=Acropora millepora TaxID=45264 RepID=UPI001CF338AD|nr:uncharacterized protein LOC122953852 [Acropora millepora]
MSFDSDDSDINFIPEVEIANARQRAAVRDETNSSSDEDNLFADEPLADEAWTARYEQELKANEELEIKLNGRLDGSVAVSEWCLFGNCAVGNIQNISECYCCREPEGCVESMRSELVLQDLAADEQKLLKCITAHPGFNAVCLQKWSLRLAADKYRTKGKQKYRQTGSEERFLRGVSYREFSRLVYGILGNRRIPLPACAYVAIRKEFPVDKDDHFTGFDLDEED